MILTSRILLLFFLFHGVLCENLDVNRDGKTCEQNEGTCVLKKYCGNKYRINSIPCRNNGLVCCRCCIALPGYSCNRLRKCNKASVRRDQRCPKKRYCCKPKRKCAQAPKNSGNRLINGQEANLNEFPFMVRLKTLYGDSTITKWYRCGGTIIHKRWILTAAHCLCDQKFSQKYQKYLDFKKTIKVYIGDHDTESTEEGEIIITATEYVNHEHHVLKTFDNDVALIRLPEEIRLSKKKRYPICLPTGDLQNLDVVGYPVTALGWGVTETGYESSTLKKQHFKVIGNGFCQLWYHTIKITDAKICAAGDNAAPCNGDSGGPMFWQSPESYYVQLGIASWNLPDGQGKCQVDSPDGYSRVQYFIPWIKKTMAKLSKNADKLP